MNHIDFTCKVAIIGKKGVGLSTLIKKLNFTKLFFSNDLLTTGVEFHTKVFSYENKNIKMLLWRLSNEEPFSIFVPNHLSGSNAIIIVYDLTDSASLRPIPDWIQETKKKCYNIPIMLLGNKVDLINNTQVSKSDIEYLLNTHNLSLSFEISAKIGTNIDIAFNTLLNKLLLTL